MPFDVCAVFAGCPEDGDEDEETEEGDGAVVAGVCEGFGGDEGADEDYGDDEDCCGGGAETRGD